MFTLACGFSLLLINEVDGGALVVEGLNEALHLIMPEVRCFKKELRRKHLVLHQLVQTLTFPKRVAQEGTAPQISLL